MPKKLGYITNVLTLLFFSLTFSQVTFAQNNCGGLDAELISISPPPPASGNYLPGTTLEFCFEIDYTAGADWLSGIELVLPLLYEPIDPLTFAVPPDCGGEWIWFDDNPCNCTGDQVTGAGWYYDSNVSGPQDGNPCNNWGAACLSGFGGAFTYCFELTIVNECPTGNPADCADASIGFLLYGDAQIGSWQSPNDCGGGSCEPEESDPIDPPIDIIIDFCDASAGIPPADPIDICGTTPVSLFDLLGPTADPGGTWTGPAGWTSPGAGNEIAFFTPSTNPILSDPPGDYTYTVTGTDNCQNFSTITFQFIDLGDGFSTTECGGDPFNLLDADVWPDPVFTPPTTGTWTYQNGAVIPNGDIDPFLNPSGEYTYEFVDAGGCFSTLIFNVDIIPTLGSEPPPILSDIDVCVLDDPFLLWDSLANTPFISTGSWIYVDFAQPFGNLLEFWIDGAPFFDGPPDLIEIDPGNYDGAGTPMQSGYLIYNSFEPDCIFNLSDTITVNAEQVFNAGEFTSATICAGDPVLFLETLLDGTPDSGGAWQDGSGNSITNPFDPSSLPFNNTYTLIYTGGLAGTLCQTSQVLSLTILDDNISTGSNSSITLCESDAAVNITDIMIANGGQPGGQWTDGSGNPSPGDFFVPGSVVPDAPPYVYTYTITSPCGNSSSTLAITVTSTGNAGTNGTLEVCPADVGVPLISGLGGTPGTTGFWTLEGIPVSNTVSGATVNNGDVYTYNIGSGSCAATSEVTIDLGTAPSAGTLPSPVNICSSEPAFSLNDLFTVPPSEPGVWTTLFGVPVPGGVIDPSTLSGTNTFVHTVTNSCGSPTAFISVVIVADPNAGNDGVVEVCANAPSGVDLSLSLGAGVTPGGTWTGPSGPATGTFNVGDPAGDYVYSVSSGAGLCTDQATLTVSYIPVANAGTNTTIEVCENNPNVIFLINELEGSPDGGGTWFPYSSYLAGVSNPNVTTYTITNIGCPPSSATMTINEIVAPNAGINTLVTKCSDLGSFPLILELDGSPDLGGTWTDAVTGNPIPASFDGTSQCGNSFSFIYTVDNGDCQSSSTLDLVIECPPNPGPSGIITTECATNAPYNLINMLDPTAPTNGNFFFQTTGIQVPGNTITLSATPGIVFDYVVPGGVACQSESATYSLIVNSPLSTTVPTNQCTPDQTQYVTTFSISGGSGIYSVAGSSGITGTITYAGAVGTFESDPIPEGTAVTFTVSDGGPCPDLTVGPVLQDCSCPVTADFADLSVNICEGETVNLTVNFSSGTPPFDYEYSDGTNTISATTATNSAVITDNPTVNTTYTITSITDANCTALSGEQVTVFVETEPDPGPAVNGLVFCGNGGAPIILASLLDPAAQTGGTFTNGVGTPVTQIANVSSSSGIYTYTVSGISCPDQSTTYEIDILDNLQATVTNVECNAAQTGYTVTIIITGGDGSYTVTGLTGSLNSTGPFSATFVSDIITANVPYSYVVSDGGTCSSVSAGPLPSPDCDCEAQASWVQPSVNICEGESVTLNVNLSGGTGPYTVEYTDGTSTFGPISGLVDGSSIAVGSPNANTTYTITSVADQFCSTSINSSVPVFVELPSDAGPDVFEEFCGNNLPYNLAISLDPTADGGGQFFDPNGDLIPTGQIILNAASSGEYTYQVSGTNCPASTSTLDLTISDEIIILPQDVEVECVPTQTGYIVSFEIEGGDGNYIVTPAGAYNGTLTPGAGNTATYVSDEIPNDVDYLFTISDGSPCPDAIVQGFDPDCDCPASAAIVSASTTSICEVGNESVVLTVDLQGDGPWTFEYENSTNPGDIQQVNTSNSPHILTVSPNETSTYTLISVSDANCNGLILGSPISVNVDPALTVSAPVEICDNVGETYTVEFEISGGISGTYQVNPLGGNIANGTDYTSAPVTSGIPYSFTVSDFGSCPDVTVDGVFECVCITDAGSLPSAPLQVCEDENLVIPAVIGEILDANDGYQFVLHDGDESSIGSTIQLFNGNVNPVPEEIEFGLTYYLTGIAGNVDLFGNVILSDNCADQTNGIPVSFFGTPSAELVGLGAICPGEEAELTISLSGDGPWNIIYSIDNVDQTAISTSDNPYSFNTGATGLYEMVSISDQNCNGITDGFVNVSNFDAPTALLSGDPGVCENSGDGPEVALTGTAPWNVFYSIDGTEVGSPITTFSNQITIPAEEEGIYEIVGLSDANCLGSFSGALDVEIIPTPSASISGGGSLCDGDEANFQVNLTGTGPWTFAYAIDNVPQSTISSPTSLYNFDSGVNGEYSITIVNDLNCQGIGDGSSASLIVNSLPTAEIIASNDQLCIGQELELIYDIQGTPPFSMTYVLDDDTVSVEGIQSDYFLTSQPIAPVFTEILFISDGSDPTCSNTPEASRFITVGALPDAPVLTSDTICADVDSVRIGVDGAAGLEYTWSPSDRLSDPKLPNPIFVLDEEEIIPLARTYTYTLVASNGECSAEDQMTITVDPGPRARFTFDPDPVTSEDTKVRFINQSSLGNDGIYFWQFDSLDISQAVNPFFQFPVAQLGEYVVNLMAIDPFTGCVNEWSDIVSVRPEILIYVPNAFTPDGDGLNDIWKPVL
ncbi:MAG: hypothetical protein AAGC47_04695, partial [Bacteroidota bacterium]